MTGLEARASEAIAVAVDAVETALVRCLEAGCDGQVVVDGLQQAITELRDVRLAVEGKS